MYNSMYMHSITFLNQTYMHIFNTKLCSISLLKSGLHPKQGKVSEDGYSTILAKLKIYLLEHLTGRYIPQKMEKQFHGWRFTANYLQVDLQISPQWEDPNLEDMYSYMRDMHPDRRILYSYIRYYG